MAEGVPPRAGERISGQWKAALGGRPCSGSGAEGRPAGSGDRFFEGVLAAHRGTADAAGTDWQSEVFRKIGEEVKADRGLAVERMVKLAGVSRASYYRFDENAETGRDPDMDLRDAIQRVALDWPAYGRRRMTQELRRRGWTVNHKRVHRIMREDNL